MNLNCKVKAETYLRQRSAKTLVIENTVSDTIQKESRVDLFVRNRSSVLENKGIGKLRSKTTNTSMWTPILEGLSKT